MSVRYFPVSSGGGGGSVTLNSAEMFPRVVRPMNWTSATNPVATYTTVPTSASAHTKGAITELVASTPADAHAIMLQVGGTFTTGSANGALMDVMIGGAGAETVLVGNLGVGNLNAVGTYGEAGGILFLPVEVPASSRLSCRWQSAHASATDASVGVALLDWDTTNSNWTPPSTLTALNADTAATTATGGGGWSTGTAWTQISASTAADYYGFVVSYNSNNTAFAANETIALQLATGGAGSETVLGTVPINFRQGTTETLTLQLPWGLPGYIAGEVPAGTRLAGRILNDGTNATTGEIIVVPVTA